MTLVRFLYNRELYLWFLQIVAYPGFLVAVMVTGLMYMWGNLLLYFMAAMCH